MDFIAKEEHDETASSPFFCRSCSQLNTQGVLKQKGLWVKRILCRFCDLERLAFWTCPFDDSRHRPPRLGTARGTSYTCPICGTHAGIACGNIQCITLCYEVREGHINLLSLNEYCINRIFRYLDPLHIIRTSRSNCKWAKALSSRQETYIMFSAEYRGCNPEQQRLLWGTNHGQLAGIKPGFDFGNQKAFFFSRWFIPLMTHLANHMNEGKMVHFAELLLGEQRSVLTGCLEQMVIQGKFPSIGGGGFVDASHTIKKGTQDYSKYPAFFQNFHLFFDAKVTLTFRKPDEMDDFRIFACKPLKPAKPLICQMRNQLLLPFMGEIQLDGELDILFNQT